MSSDLAPERPRTIGRYLLIATIGSGGMAEVFLAVAQGPGNFNKLLVTKVLRSTLVDDETFRAMFLDEARLAARMNHPNVPQTYEVGESDGHHFLTMEYLEGQPLHRVSIKLKEAFPLEHRVQVIAQVLSGLHYAHELTDYDGQPLGVVHRDISPHNVFVTYDGQVKLMDFGIAKMANASTQTATGVIKGKISYMAPEQGLGQPVDRRTDVFSVGVMLWEALTSQRMNAGDESEVATLQKRVTKPVESPLTVNPEAPQALVDICMRAVAFDAKDRFATAAEFQEALEGWLETSGRPAKARDLGKLVTDAFAAQRQRLQQAIEKQLSVVKVSASSLTLVDLARDTTGSRSGILVNEDPGSSSQSQSGVGPVATRTPAAPPAKMSTAKMAALAMIPVAAIGLLAGVARKGTTPAPTNGQITIQTDPTPTKVALPVAPSTGTTGTGTGTTGPTAASGALPPTDSSATAADGSTSAVPVPATVTASPSAKTTTTPTNHHPTRTNSTRTIDDKDPYAQ